MWTAIIQHPGMKVSKYPNNSTAEGLDLPLKQPWGTEQTFNRLEAFEKPT